LFACSEQQQSIAIKRAQIVESVYASARVEPLNAYKVNASIGGYLEQLLIQEGTLVKSGQLLAVLSNQPVLLAQRNAALGLESAQDQLDGKNNLLEELQLSLGSARAKMRLDSLNAKRMKALYNQQACSASEFEAASLQFQTSRNNVLSLQNQLARRIKELRNQVAQTRNNLSASASRSADFEIRSNQNGKIYQLTKERGELVSMQEPIAIIGDAKVFVLKLLVDEVDISKIELGQKVSVHLEAFPNQVFHAKVTKIAPKMDERSQTFEIEAQFLKQPGQLYMGLSGEANIVIEEKKNALLVPIAYLLPGNYVQTTNGKVHVRTGLSNWEYVEILDGLTEKSRLVKPE
jgi:multidrug resistance efflux pump